MFAANDQLAFQNVNEFRAFMGMKRKLCAGLESNHLHLHAVGHGHILDRYSSEETRWLPW